VEFFLHVENSEWIKVFRYISRRVSWERSGIQSLFPHSWQ
jgi:hypothetical protein